MRCDQISLLFVCSIIMIDEKLIQQVTEEEDIQKIYKIDLGAKNIEIIDNLKPYQRLRCLMLNFNYISVIENISTLTDLRELHLQGNQLTKISGLQSNKSLTLLNLASNQIQKIQGITHLTRLQTLILTKNKLSKLAGLQYLKQLKVLEVAHNQLVSVQSMPSFSKLQSLDLSHNFISKISALIFGQKNKMTALNLSHNELDDISFLSALPNLQQLNLGHNGIQKFQLGVPLNNLESLNLQSNSITELPYFSTVTPELISLNIGQNYVSSQMELIQAIANSPMLAQIEFRGNPMYSESFEQTLQKMYNFDYVNQKCINKPGTKYYNEVQEIQQEFKNNPLIYLEDDEEDRRIKLSGFYSQDLEVAMTGIKPNRPVSPTARRTKKIANGGSFDDVDKVYSEFKVNNQKINQLRNQCLVIFEKNNIQPNYEEIEKSRVTYASNMSKSQRRISSNDSVILTQPTKDELSFQAADFRRFKSVEKGLRKENQSSMNQWNQVKNNKQKSFNIRDLVRKKSGRQSTGNSQSKNSSRNDLFKTQQVGGKWSNAKILQTINRPRPSSLRKKQSSGL